ncbi:MAG: helix-hairpin-helix domain-containing protein [Candidatus Hodarchaeales archaeon]|jgi:predicted flap endonuclease-1-like 5' DNA nuclease
MPICEKCGTYFTRLPCPVCGTGEQLTTDGDILVQEYMLLTGEEGVAPEKTRRMLFFGKIAEEPFKLELTLKTRASIELVLDESTLFSGRKFGRQPDGDAEYINTVETVIQQLHMQTEIRAKEVDEALQEVLSLQTRIEELEEENELLRQQFAETGAEAPEVTAESLLSVKGVGPKTLESLRKHGIHDIKDFLRIKDLGKIANETGIPIARLEKMRKNAEKLSY